MFAIILLTTILDAELIQVANSTFPILDGKTYAPKHLHENYSTSRHMFLVDLWCVVYQPLSHEGLSCQPKKSLQLHRTRIWITTSQVGVQAFRYDFFLFDIHVVSLTIDIYIYINNYIICT